MSFAMDYDYITFKKILIDWWENDKEIGIIMIIMIIKRTDSKFTSNLIRIFIFLCYKYIDSSQ